MSYTLKANLSEVDKEVMQMAVTGFNVGNSMSLMDISLAIDYLTDKGIFEPDLQDIKDKITNKEKTIDTRSQSDLTDVEPVERG